MVVIGERTPSHGETGEMVDIVDENDVIIARVSRKEMRQGRLRHRSVFVLVRSPDGKVLIHKRSDEKDLWPGWWDIAVGGVVASGEAYDDAARRELWEEMGIDAAPVAIGEGSYEDHDVALIARCYEVVYSGDVRPQDGEVAEFRWVDPAVLAELARTRSFLPDSLALLGQRLFAD